MTTPEQELAEQRKWRPRPSAGPQPWAEELLRGEFLPPADQAARQARAIALTLRAAGAVPFWRRQFRRARLRDLSDPEALRRLPPLTRADLQANAAALRNPDLPPAERGEPTRTSGTTGMPAEVMQSKASLAMFGRLKVRELRWWRFDPMGKMLVIRPKTDFPRAADGSFLPEGKVMRLGAYTYMGHLFETGPVTCFANTNPIADQLALLRSEDPDYLLTQAANLEHLALASQGRTPPPRLRGCVGHSQTLTPAMRASIEAVFGVPVHNNYGLNEIGIAASRCPEGGRYHVHLEHCVIEIVDPEGRPVRPGEQGRILVTSVTNRAMPLIRYDADDFATAVEGPCPCGRTLPSFGEILGRYRRIALLPPGSWQRWASIQLALHGLPSEIKRGLRRYQAHEHRDGTWVLRVDATGGHEAIEAAVRAGFDAVAEGDRPVLRLIATSEFEGRPQGKFQDFLSDFVPAPEVAR